MIQTILELLIMALLESEHRTISQLDKVEAIEFSSCQVVYTLKQFREQFMEMVNY